MIKTYLVGGAVRDQLLGYAIKDRDWVVVGATAQYMLEQGYQPVGKDFPVFLHPKTKEEYALARTERKTGKGYHGFSFFAKPSVTLAKDLKRRDLTINAIAMDDQGDIIDPYKGQIDLQNKVLQHVSQAFIEDPVRVLRIARFAAKLPDFTIAPKTQELIKQMITSGELDFLVPERVWAEVAKTLKLPNPTNFFKVLFDFGVLIKTTGIWHVVPNFSGVDLLKLSSKQKFWWSLVGQNKQLAVGLDGPVVPKSWREPAKWMLDQAWQNLSLDAEILVNRCLKLDAWRRPERFLAWLDVCQNHPEINLKDKKLLEVWQQVFLHSSVVEIAELRKQGFEGELLGQAIIFARISLAQNFIASLN